MRKKKLRGFTSVRAQCAQVMECLGLGAEERTGSAKASQRPRQPHSHHGGMFLLGRNWPPVKGLAIYLLGLLLGLNKLEEQQPQVFQTSLCSDIGAEHKTDI